MSNSVTKKSTIELTKEQKARIAEEMGMLFDELVLGEIPEDVDAKTLGELNESFFIVMGRTYVTS